MCVCDRQLDFHRESRVRRRTKKTDGMLERDWYLQGLHSLAIKWLWLSVGVWTWRDIKITCALLVVNDEDYRFSGDIVRR